MPKEWFQEDYARALELKHAQDCRAGKCHMCGVIFRERKLCQHMLKNQRRGRIEEREWKPLPRPKYVEPPALQRLRFHIGREGEVRFLSHLEMMRAWIRALRRARAPLSYSQGFHAHPKVTFAAALPVGEESVGDYMDVVLKERVEPEAFLARLQATLPQGFLVVEAEEVPLKAASLMSALCGVAYSFTAVVDDLAELETRVHSIVNADEVLIERKVKAKGKPSKRPGPRKPPTTREMDIRPMIDLLAIERIDGAEVRIAFETVLYEGRLAKPKEILALLGLDPLRTRVRKERSFLQESTELVHAEASV